MIKRNIVIIIGIFVLLIGTCFSYAGLTITDNSFVNSSEVVFNGKLDFGNATINYWAETSHYIVFKDKGICYLKNGTTGTIMWSDNDDDNIINAGIENMSDTEMECIVLIGNFVIDNSITIGDFNKIILEGSISLDNDANCSAIISESDSRYFRWYGGEIFGNRGHNTKDCDGFNITSRPIMSYIKDVFVHNFSQYGINIDSGLQFSLINNMVEYTGDDGIYINGAHTDMFYNIVKWSEDDGIHFDGGTHNRVVGNLVYDSDEDGFQIGCTQSTFNGNVATYNDVNGFYVNGQENMLSGNRATHNTWYGMRIGNYHNIVGNIVVNNGDGTRDGIYSSGDYSVISNNIIRDTSGGYTVTGIELTSGSKNLTVSGNSITGCDNSITNAGTDNRIYGNYGYDVSTFNIIPVNDGSPYTYTADGLMYMQSTNQSLAVCYNDIWYYYVPT